MGLLEIIYRIKYRASDAIEIEGITCFDKNLAIALLIEKWKKGSIREMSCLTLKNLTGLDLGENSITDYTPIGELENLEELDMQTLQIENLKFMSNLNKLEYFVVEESNITDLSVLKKLPKLKNVSLDHSNENMVGML